MNGRVWSSARTPGWGTHDRPPRTGEGTTAAGPRADHGPVRVLVVDPCPDAADSLALLLSAYGCAAAVAYSGTEALAVTRRFAPGLILAELALPDRDGRDLPRHLGGTSRPLVMAVADQAEADDRRRSELAGVARHLLKPVSADDRLDVLASVADRHFPAPTG